MLDFFHSIVTYFELLWQFVTNLLSSLLNLIIVVAEAITLPQVLAGYVFPVLGSAILAVSAIAVLKLILGR